MVFVAPLIYFPTVIVYPTAFAIVDPVIPPTPFGVLKVPAVPGEPLNLLISPVV